jgi:hypothetical protein
MNGVSGSDLGKALLLIGLVSSRIGLGRLPGDFRFGRGNTRVYIPLATSLLVSIVVTVLLNLFLRR